MPSLHEVIGKSLEGYSPVEAKPPIMATVSENLQPVLNSMIRCPLPPVAITPDSLRQFYLGGQVPQLRLLSPSNSNTNGNGNTVINQTTQVINKSSGSTTVVTSPTSKSVSFTTPSLAPGAQFLTSVQMAKAFTLLSVATDNPGNIRIYGTATAQSTDTSRPLDYAVPAGTGQNIISDVGLDAAPYQWFFQNREGANADSPQSSTVYVTVINTDPLASVIYTVTIVYVPSES